jgi:hypothetical protein
MATPEGLRAFSKAHPISSPQYIEMRTHLAHTLEISITIKPIHWMPADNA